MSDPKPLNRVELARIFKDQRAIRAFEQLFELIPSQLEVTTSEIADSTSKANQNTGDINRTINELRSAKVLLWLSI